MRADGSTEAFSVGIVEAEVHGRGPIAPGNLSSRGVPPHTAPPKQLCSTTSTPITAWSIWDDGRPNGWHEGHNEAGGDQWEKLQPHSGTEGRNGPTEHRVDSG